MVICSPEEYYSDNMLHYITQQCNDASHRWIHQIIDNNLKGSNEKVYYRTSQWCLCEDKHSGSDTRYLIVFSDKSLHTIRDLRQKHVIMLREIKEYVTAWLGTQKNLFKMYFHYFPSTMQLHLHINTVHATRNYQRIQPIDTVIRNLERDSLYYSNALILTRLCKTLKRAETHKKISLHI